MEKQEFTLTEHQMELAAKLTPLQRKFIIELVKPNTTQRQAYIKAGGKAKTESAQDNSASVMLSNSKVDNFYQALLNHKTKQSIMTREEALERLSKSARVTIHDICDFTLEHVGEDEEGNPIYQTVWKMKHSDEIDPDVASAIKSVTFTNKGPKIELYDANGSIKLLADLEGWNAPKKTELSTPEGKALDVNVNNPDVAKALSDLVNKL